MTAAMNGSVNVSTNDGWIPEFEKDGVNCFVLPEIDHKIPVWEQDNIDADNLYNILETKVIPTYYDKPKNWQDIVFNGITDVVPEFSANTLAAKYYQKLY